MMAKAIIADAVNSLRYKIARGMTDQLGSIRENLPKADEAINKMTNAELLAALSEVDEYITIEDLS